MNIEEDEVKLPWVIRANGGQEFPEPANGKTWTLAELRKIVGGSVTEVPVPERSGTKNAVMVMDDAGMLKHKNHNYLASILVGFHVVGDVLVCPSKMIL